MKKRTSRKARIDRILGKAATGVFLLDAKRKLLFFNSGCERLTGWSADDVLGHVCDYSSESDPTQVAAITGGLCPPPETFAGEITTTPVYLLTKSGQTVPRLLNFFPLSDDDGQVTGVLGMVTLIEQRPKTAVTTPAQQLHAELAALRLSLRRRFDLKTLVCKSEPMTRVLQQIQLARDSSCPVVIRGGVGTGKEHVARSIHYSGPAGSRSFVPLDCKLLPALELKQTLRRLLEADPEDESTAVGLRPGTVYLSNVECMPRDVQERLIGALETGDEKRAGLRLIASSTRDLQNAVADESLRPDLFYLLTTIEIELPLLRERADDLLPLAQFFLESLNPGEAKQVGGFAEGVLELFREYNWPGNIDELMAVIEEARVACTGELIAVADLPFRFRTGFDAQAVSPPVRARSQPLAPLLEKVEKEQIQLALQQAKNNKSKAAQLLDITRARLYRRMEVLGVEDVEPTVR